MTGNPPILPADHGCHNKRMFYLKNNINLTTFIPNIVNYDWKPNTCKLVEWNGYGFCKYLGEKSILLIGDSTMYQSTLTLQNMIYQTNTTDINIWSCKDRIKFIYADIPLGRPLEHRGRGFSILHTVVKELKKYIFHDIILFTSGFHLHHKIELLDIEMKEANESFGEYLTPRIIEQLDIINSLYRDEGKKLPLIIYKTDNSPHSNCDDRIDKGTISVFIIIILYLKIEFIIININNYDGDNCYFNCYYCHYL